MHASAIPFSAAAISACANVEALLSTSVTSLAPASAQRNPNAPTWQNTSSTRASFASAATRSRFGR